MHAVQYSNAQLLKPLGATQRPPPPPPTHPAGGSELDASLARHLAGASPLTSSALRAMLGEDALARLGSAAARPLQQEFDGAVACLGALVGAYQDLAGARGGGGRACVGGRFVWGGKGGSGRQGLVAAWALLRLLSLVAGCDTTACTCCHQHPPLPVPPPPAGLAADLASAALAGGAAEERLAAVQQLLASHLHPTPFSGDQGGAGTGGPTLAREGSLGPEVAPGEAGGQLLPADRHPRASPGPAAAADASSPGITEAQGGGGSLSAACHVNLQALQARLAAWQGLVRAHQAPSRVVKWSAAGA